MGIAMLQLSCSASISVRIAIARSTGWCEKVKDKHRNEGTQHSIALASGRTATPLTC